MAASDCVQRHCYCYIASWGPMIAGSFQLKKAYSIIQGWKIKTKQIFLKNIFPLMASWGWLQNHVILHRLACKISYFSFMEHEIL